METANNEDCETLDALYSEYLTALRDVILTIENEEDINLCKQWLQAFNDSTSEHKVGRNCLIALLYQQLKSNDTLSEPFTNQSNVGRDFNAILQDLGNDCGISSKRSCSDTTSRQQEEEQTETNVENTPKQSSRSTVSIIPRNSNHFKQIEDLNRFILNMKDINETLQNELRHLRTEKGILQIKNDRKNKEMQKLLSIVKGCSESQFVESDVIKHSNREQKQKSLLQIYPIPECETQGDHSIENICGDYNSNIVIDENEVFKSMNFLMQQLKAICSAENPLEKIAEIKFSTFSEMFEKCSNILFNTKIVLYENNIQSLALQIAQSVKSFYENQVKVSNDNMRKNNLEEMKPIYKKVLSKASQTKNVTYKLRKSSSDNHRNNADNNKIRYLQKCVLKIQNSRDKIIEQYESKLREQILQNKIQQKIMRLKLASMTSKIFLRSNYKNQQELFELANHLESKYKDIVSEAIDRLRGVL